MVRGRTADALEKVARSRPDLLLKPHAHIIELIQKDPLPMMRWHLAMPLSHLSLYEETIHPSLPALISLLKDGSIFVRSWAISRLCMIARLYSLYLMNFVNEVSSLRNDKSAIICIRVRYAMKALIDPQSPFPKG